MKKKCKTHESNYHLHCKECNEIYKEDLIKLKKRIGQLQYYDTSKIVLAKKRAFQEVLEFIKKQREDGNIESEFPNGTAFYGGRGFSAGICLSDLVKFLEGKINERRKK